MLSIYSFLLLLALPWRLLSETEAGPLGFEAVYPPTLVSGQVYLDGILLPSLKWLGLLLTKV